MCLSAQKDTCYNDHQVPSSWSKLDVKSIDERTLVLLKPDALQRKLVGKIIERFENRGLKLVAVKLLLVSMDFFCGDSTRPLLCNVTSSNNYNY